MYAVRMISIPNTYAIHILYVLNMYIVITLNVFHTCIACRSSTSLTLLATRRRRLDRTPPNSTVSGSFPSFSTRRAQSSPHDACGLNRSLFLHPCTGLCAARYVACAAFSQLGKPCKTLQRSPFSAAPSRAYGSVCLVTLCLLLKGSENPPRKTSTAPLIVCPARLRDEAERQRREGVKRRYSVVLGKH